MRPNTIWFDRVTSTQDVARRFAHRGVEVAIVARIQSRGRGRFGRYWESASGGLWMSLLLFPDERFNWRHLMNMMGSLAVVRLLDEYDVGRPGIVWPNDVVVRGRKIAGILTEGHRSAVICGIGVNVNQTSFGSSLTGVTSVRLETAREHALPDVFDTLISHFYDYYRLGRRLSVAALVNEYRRHLTLTNEVVRVTVGSRTITGSPCDVDDDGRLVFRETNGLIRRLSCGQVQRLRWS